MMNRIMIIGGGLAGLSAGIKILENRHDCSVTLVNMGHHLGGRAASWRDGEGFNINHSLHAIFGKYVYFPSLLRRAGIDTKRVLVSNKGINYFYEEDGMLHSLHPSLKTKYPGYPAGDIKKIFRFGRKTYYAFHYKPAKKLEEYDDICYTAWCIQHGLEKEITEKRWFRFARDAPFTWPHEVSAYLAIKGYRLAKNAVYYYVNGTYSEHIIHPIVAYFKKLGGKMLLNKKIIELLHNGKDITEVKIADPQAGRHAFHGESWEGAVPVKPGTVASVRDFDYVVLAVPLDCFKELNQGDAAFWAGFKQVHNLSSVVTLSWQLWTREPVMPPHCITINGLDEPMYTVADYKNITDEYRKRPDIGSALEWVGQESSFESLSDEELKERTIHAFLKVPGAKDPRRAGIIHDVFRRNKAHHSRYLLTDPGTLKFRPHTKTRFRNLFLAGDWIRSQVDVPSMEAAVCSGMNAAEEILNIL